MATYSLETTALSHQYSAHQPVLNKLSLRVPTGSIYGFLGPNGAGKTTTLRLILGLLRKQEGELTIFGRPFESQRIATLQKIGSLIESPSIYGHLTATENLRVFQKVYGCSPERIGTVLQQTGLSDTGRKSAGKFSLGMKQRLAIAIALLNAPDMLILDEPTNGLDPSGIIAMRELLRSLNREQGVTILISSHLLAEISRLVTHVGIISRGQLVFQGTMTQLQQLGDGDLETTFINLTEK